MPKLTKQEYKKLVLLLVKQWEHELDGRNAIILARQIKYYELVSKEFDRLINELLNKSKGLSPNQLFRLQEYKQFREEITKQLNLYAQYNSSLISNAQMEFGNLALKNSNQVLSMLDVNFNRLPSEAISKMIGLTANGSPLYQVLQKRFSDRANEAAQILVNGIATGSNPKKVARDIRSHLDISRYDATRIARTEAINTYSQVTYDNYQQSGIVDSYLFIAESDACEECVDVESNSPYPMSDTEHIPSIHPHCRCAIAPNI